MISLASARERARAIIAKANEGIDPRAELIEAVKERRANTFTAVLDRHVKQDAMRTISRCGLYIAIALNRATGAVLESCSRTVSDHESIRGLR